MLHVYVGGLVQDCGNSIAIALELPQSCTESSVYLTIFISFYFACLKSFVHFHCITVQYNKILCTTPHWQRSNVGLILNSRKEVPRIIFCVRPTNERRRYIVTSSLNGWAHTQNDHWSTHVELRGFLFQILRVHCIGAWQVAWWPLLELLCWYPINSSPLVPHIYASVNGRSIGSGNGLLLVRCQAITWTDTDLLSIWPSGKKLHEIWIKIPNFWFNEKAFEMLL